MGVARAGRFKCASLSHGLSVAPAHRKWELWPRCGAVEGPGPTPLNFFCKREKGSGRGQGERPQRALPLLWRKVILCPSRPWQPPGDREPHKLEERVCHFPLCGVEGRQLWGTARERGLGKTLKTRRLPCHPHRRKPRAPFQPCPKLTKSLPSCAPSPSG